MNTDRIYEIVGEVEERHKESGEGFSYKDSPKLFELAALVDGYSDGDLSEQCLTTAAFANGYLGKAFERMGRIAFATERYGKAVKAYEAKLESFGVKDSGFPLALSQFVKCRNYFEDDDCEDLRQTAEKVFGSAEAIDGLLSHRRSYLHDPIEKSPEYLAVIDEVDRKVSENRTQRGLGACHEMWSLKTRFLAEKGIAWRSPAVLNPDVRFD